MKIEGRSYGGHWMPLKQEKITTGLILVLDDMTEELDIQERLTRAENLAAVGRMSAQVAHEVRNPLHSIGLEAEMAVDLAAGPVESGTQAVAAVDSAWSGSSGENYGELSEAFEAFDRPSREGRLGEVLESVLATYTSACEAQGVRVDWRWEKNSQLMVWGDRDLLEQVYGNLMGNALQALEGRAQGSTHPQITWSLGNTGDRKSLDPNRGQRPGSSRGDFARGCLRLL